MHLFYLSCQILEQLKGGHYQVACTRYFEATHKDVAIDSMSPISHPNQFFDESKKVYEGETKPSKYPEPPRYCKFRNFCEGFIFT